jgi:hypothetical protein
LIPAVACSAAVLIPTSFARTAQNLSGILAGPIKKTSPSFARPPEKLPFQSAVGKCRIANSI